MFNIAVTQFNHTNGLSLYFHLQKNCRLKDCGDVACHSVSITDDMTHAFYMPLAEVLFQDGCIQNKRFLFHSPITRLPCNEA